MGRKKYLKLVYSKSEIKKEKKKNVTFQNFIMSFMYLKYVFVPRKVKIQALRNIISSMYRDFEVSSGICDIPYHIKAENKINKIIKENKIDYYYLKLKNFQRFMNSL